MQKDLTVTQGDEREYSLSFYEQTTTPLDITGATVEMTVKRSLNSKDVTFHKVITDHTDPTNGKTSVVLTPEDTTIELGDYYYDIQLSGNGFPTRTILKGKLNISWQVTEAESE